jgi:competence protein ComEC
LQKSLIPLFYVLTLSIYGLISFQYSFYYKEENNISKHLTNIPYNAEIKASITELPQIFDNRIRLILAIQSINDSAAEGNAIATIYKNKFSKENLPSLNYGDLITLTGKIQLPPEQRNPGEFNYGNYLKLHNFDAIITSFGYENINLISRTEPNFFYSRLIFPLKQYCIFVVDSLVGSREGEYLKGLLIGERTNIPKKLREDFINAGVAHIIAVSGLNVAYVAILIWFILLLVPIDYKYKIFITILALIFYMFLTGNTPSIIRAVIMGSVFLLAKVFQRKTITYNIVAFAALIIILFDPKQLFDAGFILSFSAILSIIIIVSVFEKWLNKIKWYKNDEEQSFLNNLLKGVILLIAGTLAAQLGTLAITAMMFKKISVISIFANLFAIPLANISLAVGFIMIVASVFSFWLATVFAAYNSALLYIQLNLIEFCANLDFAFVESYFVDFLFFISYYAVLILFLTLSKKNFKFNLILIAIIIAFYFTYKDVLSKSDEAEITILHSGASDCSLIRLPYGSSILVNAGYSSKNSLSAKYNIIPYLKYKGLDKLDLIVLNSLEKNEFRNLVYLVNNFKVSKILVPVYYKNIFISFKDYFNSVDVEFISSSQIVNKSGNFRLYLYYDSIVTPKSMQTQFIYGSQSFIFNNATDFNENTYNLLYTVNQDLYNQVLKVSGNGDFISTPPQIISYYNPEYIVIAQTSYDTQKIKSEIFQKTLALLNYNVLNIEYEGALIFKTDGFNTRRIFWK